MHPGWRADGGTPEHFRKNHSLLRDELDEVLAENIKGNQRRVIGIRAFPGCLGFSAFSSTWK
jgi:hypothetical protein